MYPESKNNFKFDSQTTGPVEVSSLTLNKNLKLSTLFQY